MPFSFSLLVFSLFSTVKWEKSIIENVICVAYRVIQKHSATVDEKNKEVVLGVKLRERGRSNWNWRILRTGTLKRLSFFKVKERDKEIRSEVKKQYTRN